MLAMLRILVAFVAGDAGRRVNDGALRLTHEFGRAWQFVARFLLSRLVQIFKLEGVLVREGLLAGAASSLGADLHCTTEQ